MHKYTDLTDTDPLYLSLIHIYGKVFVDEEKELNRENRFVWEVDHPALWSAEVPNLYDLMITVTGKDGAVTELIPEKVGFRRFEMKDHMMTLNGKRIVFKGCLLYTS